MCGFWGAGQGATTRNGATAKILCLLSTLFSDFFASCGKRIETAIIEWLVVGEHAMDGMKQFTHDRTDTLQRCLAIGNKVVKISLDMLVMLFSTQGWHRQGGADMAITCLSSVDTVLKPKSQDLFNCEKRIKRFA